jgi:putative transposase
MLHSVARWGKFLLLTQTQGGVNRWRGFTCPGLVSSAPSGQNTFAFRSRSYLTGFPIMPQSLAKNLIHLIFSTKDRGRLIKDSIRIELHNYAGGILRDLDSPALLMNSVEDHIHILFNLHRTKALSDVVGELKRATSVWAKEQGPQFNNFYWQAGFGGFSVSQSGVSGVKRYIAGQAEHHRKRSFQDEFREFLHRYEVPYDEKYVWD